jgi:predicted outer membrane repeat protein
VEPAVRISRVEPAAGDLAGSGHMSGKGVRKKSQDSVLKWKRKESPTLVEIRFIPMIATLLRKGKIMAISRAIGAFAIALCVSTLAFGTIYDVPTEDNPTIEDGIDAAGVGDTVRVAPGTYALQEVGFEGKDILLVSSDPADSVVVANTILKGGGPRATLRFFHNNTPAARVQGFTLTSSTPALQFEGVNAALSISDCVFRDNYAEGYLYANPAAILIAYGAYLEVENCTFENNFTGPCMGDDGGAIQVYYDGHVTIRNCRFIDNVVGGLGGAVAIMDAGSAEIEGCLFSGNRCGYGGGAIYLTNGGSVRDCVFLHNDGRFSAGGAIMATDDLVVTGCLFEGNETEYDDGGAIIQDGGTLLLTDSVLRDNHAENGGGLSSNGSVTLIDVEITGNSASTDGGGLYFKAAEEFTDVVLTRCRIHRNECGHRGGGLRSLADNFSAYNTLIYKNQAREVGGGIVSSYENSNATLLDHCTVTGNRSPGGNDALRHGNQPLTVINSILWCNTADPILVAQGSAVTMSYSNIKGGWEGEGNIDAAPHFISALGFEAVLGIDSPCIDAGAGADDGLPWCDINPVYCTYNSQTADMGAYGGSEAVGWMEW